jgi:hypothetical protein
MIISQERLAKAMTPEQYEASMNANQELFAANRAATRLTSEERSFFSSLPAPLTVLVLTEDWCGDSAANLPIVSALAKETGKLDLRILKREGNEDITDNYQLADGRNHIPTYIVLDNHLNEIGHVIERPAAVTERMQPFKESWFAQHPNLGTAETSIAELSPEARERYLADLRHFRAGLRELEQREIIAAFAEIASRAWAPA